MNAGKYILLFFIALVLIGIFNRVTGNNENTNAQEIQNNYSKTWTSPSTAQVLKIGRALYKNNISGCGDFYFKTKNRSESVFMVACTADGKSYRYYLVWPNIEEVMPIEDDGITKPDAR